MSECTGEEKHSHYQLSTGMLVYHTHNHHSREFDFNRLHHHAPLEHEGLSEEQLQKDYEELDVPF